MKIVCDIIKIHCRYKKTNYSSNRCSMCVTVLIYHVYVPSGVGVLVRAHVGGRFGRRSRLVAAHFALY